MGLTFRSRLRVEVLGLEPNGRTGRRCLVFCWLTFAADPLPRRCAGSSSRAG